MSTFIETLILFHFHLWEGRTPAQRLYVCWAWLFFPFVFLLACIPVGGCWYPRRPVPRWVYLAVYAVAGFLIALLIYLYA